MKRIILFLSLLASVLSLSAQEVESFVRRQMAVYPQSRLLDIYKSCFQDFMGAEHLVHDAAQARAYLEKEIAETRLDSVPPRAYYELCGPSGRYVRVDLRCVVEGLIGVDALFEAFVQGNGRKHPSQRQWRREWRKMVREIDRMALPLKNYAADRQFIDSLLSAGRYAISHSPEYRAAYHPHYRIVERRLFENHIKPRLFKMGEE